MAFDGFQIRIPGLVAGEDLSAAANQYKFVTLSGDNTVVLCDATTDDPIGVLQNRPDSGEEAVVCSIGVTKVQGDADLTAGHLIGTSADGQAANYGASDTTKHIVGRIIYGNSAAGGYATAIVVCGGGRTLA